MTEQESIQLQKKILEFYQTDWDITQLDTDDCSTLDFKFALESCIQKGYLTGVSYSFGADQHLVISAYAPYVTPSGIRFIEAN